VECRLGRSNKSPRGTPKGQGWALGVCRGAQERRELQTALPMEQALLEEPGIGVGTHWARIWFTCSAGTHMAHGSRLDPPGRLCRLC
jgi:hypothetical protein